MTSSLLEQKSVVRWETADGDRFQRIPALKEWAVICSSILEGEQVLTVRKGGIREEGRRFEVRYKRFVLFPTYEHQSVCHIKPAYRRRIVDSPSVAYTAPIDSRSNSDADTLALEPSSTDARSEVQIEGFCDVAAVFKITEASSLDALNSMHIWENSYMLERLRWKPRQPLFVVALRAYALDNPIHVPNLDSYGGCKSWIELENTSHSSLLGNPVLQDSAFAAKLEALQKALAREGS